MATFDPPWRLDPTQNIVNVHWHDKPALWALLQVCVAGHNDGMVPISSNGGPWGYTQPIVKLQCSPGPTLVSDGVDSIVVSGYLYGNDYRDLPTAHGGSPDLGRRYLLPNNISNHVLTTMEGAALPSTGAWYIIDRPDLFAQHGRLNLSFLVNVGALDGSPGVDFMLTVHNPSSGLYPGPLFAKAETFRLRHPTDSITVAAEEISVPDSFGEGGVTQIWVWNVTSSVEALHSASTYIGLANVYPNDDVQFISVDVETGEVT